MWVLLTTIFIASLLGSLHCVGMCGPFALLASADARERKSAILPATAYSGGRLLTYTIVGVIFGLLGMVINQGASFASWQQAATYVAGGLMIAVGLVSLARHLGWKIPLPSVADRLTKAMQKCFRPIAKQPPIRKAFLIGALTCLMPCGWLYTFAIVAAGTGSPFLGAAVMIVFWSGTVPIMSGLMLGFNQLGRRIQKHIPVAMASLVIVVGLFTIAFRAPVAIGDDTFVVQQENSESLVEQVRDIDHSELPCCSEE